jgi:hypothetical protein
MMGYPPSRSASVGMILSARNVGAVQASSPIRAITLTPKTSATTNGEFVEPISLLIKAGIAVLRRLTSVR